MSTPTSRDHAGRVRALGREILPAIPGSQALYADQHESEPYTGVEIVRDAAYGPHPRHRLDVFAAPKGGESRPVFLFVHGGGFVMGDKHQPGSPYHDNVALWAVRHGLVGVNMTYRLAPEFKYPSGSEDVAAAVAWIREHAAEFGGDPGRIVVLGTSAGAVHVANFLAQPMFGSARAGVVLGVLLSGVYDMAGATPEQVSTAYYGEDAGAYARMSPLPGLVESPIPLLFVITEFDPAMFEEQALRVIQAWSDRHGHWPNLIRMTGHNHLTSTLHMNTADDYLGGQIMRLLDGA